MSDSRLYKFCLHCDKPLIQTGRGRLRMYCTREHWKAAQRQASLNMDRLDEEITNPAIRTDDVYRLVTMVDPIGPVLQPLPQIARQDVRNGVPMRVV